MTLVPLQLSATAPSLQVETAGEKLGGETVTHTKPTIDARLELMIAQLDDIMSKLQTLKKPKKTA